MSQLSLSLFFSPWIKPDRVVYWNRSGWRVERYWPDRGAWLLSCPVGVKLVVDQSESLGRVVWLDTPFVTVCFTEERLQEATDILDQFLRDGSSVWGRIEVRPSETKWTL